MIQPLRTIHRWVFTAFAFLLPSVVIIAVIERHQYLETGQIRIEPLSSTPVISQRGQFQVMSVSDGIALSARSSRPLPEVLVYWSSVQVKGSLPFDARLLGTYRDGTHFELPQEPSGTVLLFSPVRNSVIDSIPIGRPR